MELVLDIKHVGAFVGGAVVGGITDVAIDKALLFLVKDPEKLRVVGEIFVTDVVNFLLYGGLTAIGLKTKKPVLIAFGLGGLAVQIGEEIIDHLGKYWHSFNVPIDYTVPPIKEI